MLDLDLRSRFAPVASRVSVALLLFLIACGIGEAPLLAQAALLEPRDVPRTTQMIIGTVHVSIGRAYQGRAAGGFVIAIDDARQTLLAETRTDSEGTYTLAIPMGESVEIVACVHTGVGDAIGFRETIVLAPSVYPPRTNLVAELRVAEMGEGDPAQPSAGLGLLGVLGRYAEVVSAGQAAEAKGPALFEYCRAMAQSSPQVMWSPKHRREAVSVKSASRPRSLTVF